MLVSSPRTWGCFYLFWCPVAHAHVFPTHVGVFPKEQNNGRRSWRLPHARGGVSIGDVCDFNAAKSSPRTWGCFPLRGSLMQWCRVFPTHVGVFLTSAETWGDLRRLPHARGGVSEFSDIVLGGHTSSPRTWGCFQRMAESRWNLHVFPTHVGVFPKATRPPALAYRLPHARGGVSPNALATAPCTLSSPRTWGCFRGNVWPPKCEVVFPTHVGVFPTRTPCSST